ncbi:DUF1553 domain-containing protein [Adhaeribacter rhizoryzae]|uniref:DUF1553 domain-containing protein n=1 Tax=Adhaeribacter rhizoryzae TaxID=2607907 RepID=A0A5M6DJ25_9BACT|nr:DUF1553 domain-containing protein [Adhaeribacter rhizoryzae]KAA5546376.1 DUF1553 domain-containing protein [Adhaeribacter rhizoryzae]
MFQKNVFTSALVLILAGVVYFSCIRQPEKSVDFNADVRPILNTKCISCHGGVKEKSGFSLFSRADALRKNNSGKPAIIPGDPENSEFIRRLTAKDPEERMPYHAEPLPQAEIDILKQWIKEGAKWADHWAYISPKNPKVPTDELRAAVNPIDNFVQARLQQEGLKPAPIADKATLLRRLSLDLIGLPPTEKELQDFIQDSSPQAYEKQADRLLASPHFGERWAAMWLDLARYSDSKGYEKDDYRNVWRYRDYVIQSFNQDKPFNQFTIEQLAGDLLPQPTEEQLIATAYHRNTANNDEGGTDDEEFRTAALLDRVSNTWEVWQGTTMGCVQCHSHPYDPFRHEDFYQSMAFFNNTRDEDIPNESPTLVHLKPEDELLIKELKEWVTKELPVAQKSTEIIRIEKLVRITEPKIHPHAFDKLTNAALADGKYLGGGHNGFARLKGINLTGKTDLIVSIANRKGGGTLQVRQDRLDGEVLAEFKTAPEQEGRGYRREIINLNPTTGKHDLYVVFLNPALANPQDYVYQLEWLLFTEPLPGAGKPGYAEAKNKLQQLLNAEAEKTPIIQENPRDFWRQTYLFERGDWKTKGKAVRPSTPKFLNAFVKYQPNRLGLAKWLVSPDNPLTARVTVNRFWEQLFGYGLVESLEDFGSQGTKPSHPELLDWLALNFQHEQGWQVKKLLKLLVLSHTYRQSSKTTPELTQKDPANRLLARGPRVRLTAEQIRDQALAVGGLLSSKMYGRSVMPPQPEGVWQVVYSGMKWETSTGEDAFRRAVYTFWRRSVPYPSLQTFDAAGREICVSRRIRTNTPLQALVTLNDTVYMLAAQGLARKMQQSGKSPTEQITSGYEAALFRKPATLKLKALTKLYQQADIYYSQHPQDASQFIGKEAANQNPVPRQLAALTLVANAILNLDEFVMKE